VKAQPLPRVLMLLENYPYPQDGRVRHEAVALVEAAYQVTVICPAAKGQPHHEAIAGVQVYRFPSPPTATGIWGYVLEYGFAMAMMLILSVVVALREGFDIIHAHNPPDTLALIAAFYKLFGIQFVYDQHDLCPEMYDARFDGQGKAIVARALLFFERLSYRTADHVVVTNESYRAMAMERGHVPVERITIVRNGPDPTRFRLGPPDLELRQKAAILIGYVGVIGLQDGVGGLLRSLAHLTYELNRRDFYCVIMGDGDALARSKALATELNLKPFVEFTGWVSGDKLIRYLSTIDIGVEPAPNNPYINRSTMIKLMEYLAMAKPIVAYDLTEHRVTAQEAALYALPGDESDFARRIANLMDDAERREQMGTFGRKRVEDELAWSYQQQHLLRLYQRLAFQWAKRKHDVPYRNHQSGT
jgi:glycosyltransferase involved in cell wall biosynthesis